MAGGTGGGERNQWSGGSVSNAGTNATSGQSGGSGTAGTSGIGGASGGAAGGASGTGGANGGNSDAMRRHCGRAAAMRVAALVVQAAMARARHHARARLRAQAAEPPARVAQAAMRCWRVVMARVAPKRGRRRCDGRRRRRRQRRHMGHGGSLAGRWWQPAGGGRGDGRWRRHDVQRRVPCGNSAGIIGKMYTLNHFVILRSGSAASSDGQRHLERRPRSSSSSS